LIKKTGLVSLACMFMLILFESCDEALMPPSKPGADSVPEYILSFSGQWTDPGGGPTTGLVVSANGNVYVGAETTPRRTGWPSPDLYLFSPKGAEVNAWDILWRPSGLGIGLDGSIVAVDSYLATVTLISSDGGKVETWGEGQLTNPTDVDIDSRGNLYIADAGSDRIQKFTPHGFPLLKWGTTGADNGEFNSPRGIAVNDSDEVFVWDTGNNRVQYFDTQGHFLGKWAASDSTRVLEPWPMGIAGIDAGPEGVVYLVDSGGVQVVKFSTDGRILARWGKAGTEPGTFTSPGNIAVGPAGSIYVSDVGRRVVDRFDY